MLIALAGAALIALDPLGIEEATAARAEKTVMRMSSALYPLPFDKPSEVTVVLLDEEFIARSGGTWPIRYDKQARLLKELVDRDPAALFVDLLYRTNHGRDDSPADLLEQISETEIPVYLATTAVHPAACRTVSGAASTPARAAVGNIDGSIYRDTLNLKRGGFALVEWHGCPGEYPMYPIGTKELATPAYALHLEVKCMREGKERTRCLRDMADPDFAEPMKIRWGAFPPAIDPRVPSPTKCRYTSRPPAPVWRRAAVLIQELLYATVGNQDAHARLPCPAINVVSASVFSDESLSAEARKAVDQLVSDKFVLVGADVPGSSDVAVSPVHGQMPGVMVHGMALDNLLKYKQYYVKPVSEILMHIFWHPLTLILVAAIAYRVPGARLQRPLEIAGLVFLAALAATWWWVEERRALAAVAVFGGALLFVIAPTAVGRAVFWFAFICLAAVGLIELGHAPTNYLVLAIAAVLVGEKVYDEMNGAREQEIVTARLGRVLRSIEWALGISKKSGSQSSGEISHEVRSEIRIVRIRAAWYQRFRSNARRLQDGSGRRGNER